MSKTDSPIEVSNETFDKLIKNHVEKMWGGLEMASVQYFVETGKVNGNFRLRLLSLMKFYQWEREKLSPKEDQQPSQPIKSKEEILKSVNVNIDAWIDYSALLEAMEEYRNQPKDQQPSGDVGLEFAKWLEENTKVIYEEKITLYRYEDFDGVGNYTLDDIYTVYCDFEYGSYMPNTQPIKEDTPAGDEKLKVDL